MLNINNSDLETNQIQENEVIAKRIMLTYFHVASYNNQDKIRKSIEDFIADMYIHCPNYEMDSYFFIIDTNLYHNKLYVFKDDNPHMYKFNKNMSNNDCVDFTLKLLNDDLTLLDQRENVEYYCESAFIFSNPGLDINACSIEDSIILEKYDMDTMCEEINIQDIIDWDYSFIVPSNYVLDEIEFTEVDSKDKI
ncbi:MAG: hypothetical protein DRG78_07955 [Epsilonproteobacteria bacterium]|nr:MAG: hypothetical protein DRG78_07955 [Campylobacterota bacterium]